jgi:hypothetical protein
MQLFGDLTHDDPYIVFMGNSQYGILRRVTEMLCRAFARLNYPSYLVDLADSTSLNSMQTYIQKNPVKAFIGFNAWGRDFKVSGQSMYDLLKTPHITILGDHPLYHAARLTPKFKESIILLNDDHHLDFLNTWLPHTGVRAVLCMGLELPEVFPDPLSERPYDFVFLGSYVNPQEYKEKLQFPEPAYQRVVWETIEQALWCTTETLESIWYRNLLTIGITHTDMPQAHMLEILFNMDRYIRFSRREHAIQQFKTLPLTILGKGWGQFNTTQSNLTVIEGEENTVDTIVPQAKMLLNVLPNNRGSAHDRIVQAYRYSTLCVTDTNPWLEKHFGGDAPGCVFYDFKEAGLEERLVDLLQNDQARSAMVGRFGESAQALFNIDQSVLRLQDFVQAHQCLKIIGK